jgi:hypothetical protein
MAVATEAVVACASLGANGKIVSVTLLPDQRRLVTSAQRGFSVTAPGEPGAHGMTGKEEIQARSAEVLRLAGTDPDRAAYPDG